MFSFLKRLFRKYPKPDPSPERPESNDRCEVVFATEEKRSYACGHSGAAIYQISIYGQKTKLIDGKELCPDCAIAWLKEDVIRCALCGLPIMPGEPVALYIPMRDMPHLDTAKHIDDYTVLGCMGWDCCPSGGFFGGYWTTEGFKPAFDGNVLAGHVLKTGEPTVINI